MNKLPTEILGVILYWTTKLCKCDKNTLIPLRLVCKAFDAGLRQYIFKCIQLEFSRFRRDVEPLDVGALQRIGAHAEALYVDVMVVRDEEEIDRLTQVFQGLIPKVPEMVPLLESLRKYCMNDTTFDETDYRRVVETALAHTPNMTKLKVNLPFQVVGQQSRTATLLLGNTMASLKNRPEEFKYVQHLVLDHVSDTTLIDLCNNHIDFGNAMHVFKGLKHLVMSIKRQENRYSRQSTFSQNLWILIEKATGLRSLCLVGWNVRRNIDTRVHVHGVQQQVWNMRSMPFTREHLAEKLVALQALELKRVDMDPHALFSLLKQLSNTLVEVYLNEVYLKVRSTQALGNTSLWIGYPGLPKPEGCCWLAEDLYNLESLNLMTLRVTGLGYDDFEPTIRGSPSEYDLKDPSGQNRSFDERFVKAVMEGPDPIIMETVNNLVINPPVWPPIASSPVASPTNSRPQSSAEPDPLSDEAKEARRKEKVALHRRMLRYDCDTAQRYHNTTSYFKRCIDGYFFNHNEQALKELQNIIQVADRGMSLLQTEIDRAREEHRDTTTASGSTTTAGTMTGAGPTMMMAANGLANGHIMPNIPTPDEGPRIPSPALIHVCSGLLSTIRYHCIVGLSNNVCPYKGLSYMGFKITKEDLMISLRDLRHEIKYGYTPTPARRLRTWNVDIADIAEAIDYSYPLQRWNPAAPLPPTTAMNGGFQAEHGN